MAAAPFSLRTDRLVLDAMRLDDAPVVLAEWGVPEVARMTSTFRTDWTLDEVRDWIAARLQSDDRGIGCAIRRASDRRLIGSVGMGGTPVKLGYALGKAFWGQGYGIEAAHAFLTAAYADDRQLDIIEAGVFDDNPASSRLLAKLGFAWVGLGDCASLARVEPAANSLYRLTRDAFEASQ